MSFSARPLAPVRQGLGFLAGVVALSLGCPGTVGVGAELNRSDALVSGSRTAIAEDKTRLSAEQLADRIDELLQGAWAAEHVTPAPPCSDEEFVRRVYLDLVGRIPSVAETIGFVDERRSDKRRRLIDQLLERGASAAHLANTWRDWMLAGANAEARSQSLGLESWLRLRFAVNMPYDQMVRELVTWPVRAGGTNMIDPTPAAFYQAGDYKPEHLAANTSRMFLGIQLQCAQCHDHPTAAWKQTQFWEFAAFFQGTGGEPADLAGQVMAKIGIDGLKIPNTDVVVSAKFLDGTAPTFQSGDGKREVLARWLVSRDNPLFARATVNRVWDHFFGRGLVQPVDNLETSNPPFQPELFDLVAEQFVAHGYDLKYLIRAITASRAYQLSSQGDSDEATKESAAERHEKQRRSFARMPVRRMTADQLYASFVQATGFEPPTETSQQPTSARQEFLARFGDTSVPRTEAPTTILQALALLNGKYVAEATDLKHSKTLASIAEAPYLDADGRIEMLFLSALSRKPEAGELEEFKTYLAASKPDHEREALADVFWTLLNSAEFVLNH